jgi:hypothetical protein
MATFSESTVGPLCDFAHASVDHRRQLLNVLCIPIIGAEIVGLIMIST